MDRIERLDALSIRDLRALVILSERGHFANAADAFGITQPALSALVKKIETALDTRLFERTSRRFHVTVEGETVLAHVRAVLEEIERLAAMADAPRQPLDGAFRLGAIPTLGPYYLPSVLQPLTDRFTGLRLSLIEAKTETLIGQLRQREIDAALLALPPGEPGLDTLPLFREPFRLAVPAGHSLERGHTVWIGELNPDELIMLERGNCLRDQTLDACGAARGGGERPVHAASLETLRCLVAARMGIAVLPAMACAPDPRLPQVRFLDFAPPAPGRVIGLVFRRTGDAAKECQTLAAFLRACLPSEVSPV